MKILRETRKKPLHFVSHPQSASRSASRNFSRILQHCNAVHFSYNSAHRLSL